MARIDLFVRPDGEVIVNEINTIPGIHRDERLREALRGVRDPVRELLDRLIELALERHERRSQARLLEAGEQTLGLRAVPFEAERGESLVRAFQRARRHAHDAKCAKRKGLEEETDRRRRPARSSST